MTAGSRGISWLLAAEWNIVGLAEGCLVVRSVVPARWNDLKLHVRSLSRLRSPVLPALAVLALLPATALGQDGPVRFDADSRTRGLGGAWGHSWRLFGLGRTRTDSSFVAFHPQMGWFVTDRLELYGEGTLLVYTEPGLAVAGGLTGLAGRLHLWNDRAWTPYLTLGGGILWTSLDTMEIDRRFNFQILYGIGVRLLPRRGPGWVIEVRNHHISNAGTAGENLGINAATVMAGVQWILR